MEQPAQNVVMTNAIPVRTSLLELDPHNRTSAGVFVVRKQSTKDMRANRIC